MADDTTINHHQTDQSEGVSQSERLDVAEVLPGLQLRPLPDGATWAFAFLVIKLVDEEGDTAWAYSTSAAPNREELLGALVVHVDVYRKELVSRWEESDAQDVMDFTGSLGERRDVAEVLPGLQVHPLPPGHRWSSVLLLVKFQHERGHTGWARLSAGMSSEPELLGALSVQAELLRRELVEEWDPEEDDN